MRKNKGFTLVELLAVILILGIILSISIPSVISLLKNSTKQSFVLDTQNLLEEIKNKGLKNVNFDPTTVNETTLESILDINSDNYQKVTVTMVSDKVHVVIIGKNKWSGYTTCGTSDSVSIVEGSEICNS